MRAKTKSATVAPALRRYVATPGHFQCECNGWVWYVLKVNRLGEYGTSFCRVTSPIMPSGEMGDTYNRDIPGFDEAYNAAVNRLSDL